MARKLNAENKSLIMRFGAICNSHMKSTTDRFAALGDSIDVIKSSVSSLDSHLASIDTRLKNIEDTLAPNSVFPHPPPNSNVPSPESCLLVSPQPDVPSQQSRLEDILTQTAGMVAGIRDDTRVNDNGCVAMRDCVLRLLEDFNLLDQLVAKSKSSSNADVTARRQSSDRSEEHTSNSSHSGESRMPSSA